MKTLLAWLVVHAAICTGAAAAVMHIERRAPPERVAIAVDASFAMREVWESVPKVLERIEARHGGAQFLVVTQPGKTGQWSARPRLEGARPFAPRQIESLRSMAVWEEADQVYLVTNAPEGEIDVPGAWRIERAQR